MKKVSVYFTNPQSDVLEALAAQAGITFAEALRRALDEWHTLKEGQSMTTPVVGRTRSTVSLVYMDDGERTSLTFRNADIVHDDYYHTLTVYRVKQDGSEGRTLGKFDEGDVVTWYIEGEQDTEE